MVQLTVNYRIKQCLSGVFPMFCIHLFLNKIKKNNDQRYQQQGSGLFSDKYRALKQGDVPCTVQKNSEFRNNHMILLSVITKDL